jgi:putative CocE/NonD family hydrolase
VKLLAYLLASFLIAGAVRAWAAPDPDDLAAAIPRLASETLEHYRDDNHDMYLRNLAMLQWAAGQPVKAAETIHAWLAQHAAGEDLSTIGQQMYVGAQGRMARDKISFADAVRQEFQAVFARLSNRQALDAEYFLAASPSVYKEALKQAQAHGTEHPSQAEVIALIGVYLSYRAFDSIAPIVNPLIAEDDTRRYDIKDDVLIRTPEGATLSAFVVRDRSVTTPQPVALTATQQTSPAAELYQAKLAAIHGYVGVSSDSRGKRLSPDDIVLYEDDARDLYWVIDWISKQPWSDGRVGMWGGSIEGFMQWAAAKTLHPALKTIVPYCPENPGYGLPMQNNVFLNANWAYRFYVTNNKYLDEKTNSDRERWNSLLRNWYSSGRRYREIDQIDGTPDPWLHRFLAHPSYDQYYQQMTAYGDDFARLNIPVLAIDGYYDDGQSFAMLNLQEHYRHNPHAEHYLLIGPYDHFGTQSSFKPPVLRGYAIDPVAQFDTSAITFQWFDHVLRGGPLPALLQDRINYEVMGANLWRHAPSLEKVHNDTLRLYLSDAKAGQYRTLTPVRPANRGEIPQTVDLADRSSFSAPTYPDVVVAPRLDTSSGLTFISNPLQEPLAVSGMFSANLKLVTNKKDLDIAMVLYEVTPDGQFFHLADTIQRASYAKDMTTRHLLQPGHLETVPIERTLFVSRELARGSRLLVVLDVNKGPMAQINYGTGKDVSDESIADAKEPVKIAWHTDSEVDVPVWK